MWDDILLKAPKIWKAMEERWKTGVKNLGVTDAL